MGRSLSGRIIFMGTPAFAEVSLKALLNSGNPPVAVFTNPDKRAGRGRALRPSPVKETALDNELELFQPTTLREPEIAGKIRSFHPDFIAVVAYGKLLPPELLEIPRLGCVNVHASILPRHRGASPIAHAILAGDRTTGITTIRMDEGMDTGPVYLKREVAIPDDATNESLSEMLAPLGGDLLIATLRGLEVGVLEAVPQKTESVTMAPKLSSKDGLLDFTMPAEVLERRVRAFHPWPGTYFKIDEIEVKVLKAEVGEKVPAGIKPGTIRTGDGFLIACGDGRFLRLLEVQKRGRRAMAAADFLRGFNVGSHNS